MRLTPVTTKFLFTAGVLLCLLALTIGAAYLNLGPFNTFAALAISAVKAALILGVFMEIRGRSPVVRVALTAGFFFLAILFALAMGDFMTRGWLRPGSESNQAIGDNANPRPPADGRTSRVKPAGAEQ